MHCTREIKPQIHWIGGSDRRLALFENMFPLTNGVAYNSYLIMDEKITIMDTVDSSITRQYLENIEFLLDGKEADYLVVSHMEPDHCSNIDELTRRYPNMKIVGNKTTFRMISQFYQHDLSARFHEVKEGDELSLGSHTLKFYFAPMVHWPEVMIAYESSEGILFSADAFGSFGAFAGNLFADEMDFDESFMGEARRYYANIVGKYGVQVQNVLKKLDGVSINMVCSLHGPIWRTDAGNIIDKYVHWSTYKPEKAGVVLLYASMYGNTENAVNIIASKLGEKGIRDIRMYDVSKTDHSYIIADIFKYSHIVLGAPTYNGGLYPKMEHLLHEMAMLGVKGRKVALVGNGSWASASVKVMEKHLGEMKDMEILGNPLQLMSTLKPEQLEGVDALVDAIYQSIENV